jgi:hypothetical protein
MTFGDTFGSKQIGHVDILDFSPDTYREQIFVFLLPGNITTIRLSLRRTLVHFVHYSAVISIL